MSEAVEADRMLAAFSRGLEEQLADPRVRALWAVALQSHMASAGFGSPAFGTLARPKEGAPGGGRPEGGGGRPVGTWTPPPATSNQPSPVITRAFWWGFHFEIPHDTLQFILIAANTVNTFVQLVGMETGPAAPFIELAAAFVSQFLTIMSNMDVGKGIYLSMSWFAIGVFIPTPV